MGSTDTFFLRNIVREFDIKPGVGNQEEGIC
jgi:hypothetical protein